MTIQNDTSQISPGRHHVSKSYIPLTILRGFWSMVLITAVMLANMIKDIHSLVALFSTGMWVMIFIGIFLLLALIVAVFAFISYRHITWEITDDELHVCKGILTKKRSHIPFRRIHSIDINAKILDRICGVVTFKIDTAGGSAKSEDAKIPALHLNTAEALRAEIFKRKNDILTHSNPQQAAVGGGNIMTELSNANEGIRGAFAGMSGVSATAEAEYRLSNKELVILCLANGKAFAFILACFFLVYQSLDFISLFDENFVEHASDFSLYILSKGPIIVGAIVIIALVISLIVSFLTRALTYGNFVAKRYGARIEITRGLLERKSIGVAVERIQSLKIKQGLFQRILGYAEISLETASGFGKSQNESGGQFGVVIHPFIKTKNIDDYMHKMLKEFDDYPKDFTPLTTVAMRRSMVRYAICTFLFILVPLNVCWLILYHYSDVNFPGVVNDSVIASSVALLIIMIATGWGAWRGRGYSRNDKYLAMRKGILGRTKIYIPKNKIQYATVAQNPFQKRVLLATLKANTAASGSSSEALKDIGTETCDEYLSWIESKRVS